MQLKRKLLHIFEKDISEIGIEHVEKNKLFSWNPDPVLELNLQISDITEM